MPEQKDSVAGSPSLLGILGLSGSDSELSPAWTAQSIQMLSSLWPLFLLAKLCILALTIDISGFFLSGPHIVHLMMPIVLGADLAIWLLPRRPGFRGLKPHRQMAALALLVLASGLSTGLSLGWLSPPHLSGWVPPLAAQFCLALVLMGILGHQRLLGLAYCTGMSVGILSGGEAGPVILAAVLLAAVSVATISQARFERLRLLAHQKSEMRSQRAHHLLTEYEESGHGWFWETDRRGAITYISDRLVRSLGIGAQHLIGRRLTELVVTGDRSGGEGDRTLSFHLSARSAFSDISVRSAIGEDERWWAISGRPVINEYGQFQGFRGSGSDLTEMKRSQAEVSRLAQFDSLTGLANRIQMLRVLEQGVSAANGRTGECALFLIDLDRFKNVNDTMGHPAGDELLREVGLRLNRMVADRGVVGRLGGDEFKVVLPGHVERAQLAVLADAIIASLSQPYMVEGVQVVIGASIGIALCPDDGANVDELIRNADLALYAAKGEGRGVHRFYCADMLAEAEDRRQLEEDLRGALAQGALELVYQPVVSAKTEEITAFETLLRWNHPQRGSISPAVFVPVAEDAGLIGALGEWVLRTACEAANHWPEEIKIAVNVSPLQFTNPALPGIVMNALASSGLAAGRLELEITESAFIHEGDATDHMFAQLKAIGVRLALDDFGTGYSSLGYLRKAPFDKIKIDQSFVRGAAVRGSRNAAIITSIVSLAEALGMDTTAEGVETHDELALVRSLGCSQIQGFIYGKGSGAAEVAQRFAEQGLAAKADGFKSSRSPRLSMLRSVVLHHEGQRYVGRVRNISSGGAMIEGLWNVPEDTIFQIQLADGLTVDAATRWSVDDRMGVQFDRPIDLRTAQAAPPVRLAG